MTTAAKKILLIGATGVIGRAVDELLSKRHKVIRAGIVDCDVNFDFSDPQQLLTALKQVGKVDAIISTAGRANFVKLADVKVAKLEDSAYGLGLLDKLMGQVNLVLAARDYLTDGGSVTLTSGTTSDDPIIGGSSLSMANGALEAWAKAVATEMLRGIRVNVVSPSLAAETPPQGLAAFPGFEPIPAARIALAYVRCVESLITGQTIKI